jgi:hypothetical protein
MHRIAQNEVRIPGPKWSQVSDRKLATRVAASRRTSLCGCHSERSEESRPGCFQASARFFVACGTPENHPRSTSYGHAMACPYAAARWDNPRAVKPPLIPTGPRPLQLVG